MKLCIAQKNLTVGAIEDNCREIIASVHRASEEKYDMIVFPELALSAYPPEDLLLRPGFIQKCQACLGEICSIARGITALVGYPLADDGGLFNACAVIQDGRITHSVKKQILPNYGVFDEKRYFEKGDETVVLDLCGIKTAVTICEDLWDPQPAEQAGKADAQLLININASPFHTSKVAQRQDIIRQRARDNALDIVYVNLVGGQDELVFDGASMACDHDGNIT